MMTGVWARTYAASSCRRWDLLGQSQQLPRVLYAETQWLGPLIPYHSVSTATTRAMQNCQCHLRALARSCCFVPPLLTALRFRLQGRGSRPRAPPKTPIPIPIIRIRAPLSLYYDVHRHSCIQKRKETTDLKSLDCVRSAASRSFDFDPRCLCVV